MIGDCADFESANIGVFRFAYIGLSAYDCSVDMRLFVPDYT
jgi:hypothetical protein